MAVRPVLSSGDTANFGIPGSQLALDVWQRLYKYVGNTYKLALVTMPATGLYSPIAANRSFESNDILVSRSSAIDSGIFMVADHSLGIHHTEVVDRQDIQDIIITKALTNTSGVDWRK